LEEEEKIGVLLKFALIRELAFGRVYLLEMLLDFTLLRSCINFSLIKREGDKRRTSSRAIRF
jgi:hypothetical protein